MTPEQYAPHPPEPPSIAVAVLSQLLAELPADWRVSVEDPTQMLLFDAQMQPRGLINIAAGTTRQITLADDVNT